MSSNSINNYFIQTKQALITDYFHKQEDVQKKVKVYGYNSKTNSWHCIECGVDMGPSNPRQVCGKYQCFGYGY